MALPFIAGIAVGAGVALLFTKRKQVKEALSDSAVCENIQKGVQEGLDKGKELSTKALQYVRDNLNSLTNTESNAKDSTKESPKNTNKAFQASKTTKNKRATKETKEAEGNL